MKGILRINKNKIYFEIICMMPFSFFCSIIISITNKKEIKIQTESKMVSDDDMFPHK